MKIGKELGLRARDARAHPQSEAFSHTHAVGSWLDAICSRATIAADGGCDCITVFLKYDRRAEQALTVMKQELIAWLKKNDIKLEELSPTQNERELKLMIRWSVA